MGREKGAIVSDEINEIPTGPIAPEIVLPSAGAVDVADLSSKLTDDWKAVKKQLDATKTELAATKSELADAKTELAAKNDALSEAHAIVATSRSIPSLILPDGQPISEDKLTQSQQVHILIGQEMARLSQLAQPGKLLNVDDLLSGPLHK